MKITEYLKKYSLSQLQFAEKIGVTQAAISRIIHGNRKPHPDLAEKIEAATNGEVTKEEAIWGNEANVRKKLKE